MAQSAYQSKLRLTKDEGLISGSFKIRVQHETPNETHLYDSGLFDLQNCGLSEHEAISDHFQISSLIGADIADPHGPDQPTLLTQRRFIEALLTQEGLSYTLVDKANAFDDKLSTGHYNLIALFNEKIKLSEATQQKIVNAVYSGIGLLRAGGHDQLDDQIETALGIKVTEEIPKTTNLFIDEPTLLLDPSNLSLVGSTTIRKIQLEGAQTLGIFNTEKGDMAAITEYEYGIGRSIYMPFDLLLEASLAGSESEFANLLAAAFNKATSNPITETTRIIPWTLSLQNQGNAVLGQALLQIPEGSNVIDAGQAGLNANRLIWPFSLNINQRQDLTFWLQLPSSPGEIKLLGQVSVYNSQDLLEPLVALEESLTVTQNTSEEPPETTEDDCYRIRSSQTDAYLTSTAEGIIAPTATKEEASRYCLEPINGRYKIYDSITQNYWKRKTGGANDLILLNGTQDTATEFHRHECFYANETNRYGLSDPTDGGTPNVKLLDDKSGLIANDWRVCDSTQERTSLGFLFEPLNSRD